MQLLFLYVFLHCREGCHLLLGCCCCAAGSGMLLVGRASKREACLHTAARKTAQCEEDTDAESHH